MALLLATLLAIRGNKTKKNIAFCVNVLCSVPYPGKSKKRLSGSGAVAAFAVGLLSFCVSYRFGWILISFYLSSSKVRHCSHEIDLYFILSCIIHVHTQLTKYKAHIKAKLEQDHEKESARGAEQVLC